MATKHYEAYRVTVAKDKNDKVSFKKEKKLYDSVLTDNQLQTLNEQSANTKVRYYEIIKKETPADPKSGAGSDKK